MRSGWRGGKVLSSGGMGSKWALPCDFADFHSFCRATAKNGEDLAMTVEFAVAETVIYEYDFSQSSLSGMAVACGLRAEQKICFSRRI
jgi:hypothetical protein